MTPRLFASLLAAMSLSACATGPIAAAGDVHALLISVRDNDRPSFETHVDRSALRENFQARLVSRAKALNRGVVVDALGVLLSGQAARVADGMLIQPEVFLAVAEYYGYRPGRPVPGPLALSTVLKDGPYGTVCATSGHGGPCVLTFQHEASIWRLVDIDPEAARFGGQLR